MLRMKIENTKILIFVSDPNQSVTYSADVVSDFLKVFLMSGKNVVSKLLLCEAPLLMRLSPDIFHKKKRPLEKKTNFSFLNFLEGYPAKSK